MTSYLEGENKEAIIPTISSRTLLPQPQSMPAKWILSTHLTPLKLGLVSKRNVENPSPSRTVASPSLSPYNLLSHLLGKSQVTSTTELPGSLGNVVFCF